MTEIASRSSSAVDSPHQAVTIGVPAALVEWAHAAHSAHQLATSLTATSFCPDAFRGKPGEATAAILAGSEVGLSPIAALNAFDVIQGRPAPKALTLRALVQSQGHEVWVESATPSRCVMRGRRRGSDVVQESEWTITRAASLKLTNKPNWQNQPQAMLIARATSEICRLVAADVILGVPYSAEEIADEQPGPTTILRRAETPSDPESPAPAKRTAKRASAPAPAEPDLQPDGPADESITDAQLKKLHTVMGEHGLTDRDTGLAYIGNVIGRDINSSKDLTKAEASRVIDLLESGGIPEEPPFEELPESNWPPVRQPPPDPENQA